MDFKLIESEEIRVECELRNISCLTSVQQYILQMYLENEATGNEVRPMLAHSRALKNPKREVAL